METGAVVVKADDVPSSSSSSLSVVTGNNLKASLRSGSLAAAVNSSPTTTTTTTSASSTNTNERLDFIGSSKAVKKLFSMSLDVGAKQDITTQQTQKTNKKPTLLAIHNFDGTLIIDDAEDESNYESFHEQNQNQHDDDQDYHLYRDSWNSDSVATKKTLLPPSDQSLSLALTSGNQEDALSMITNMVQQSNDINSSQQSPHKQEAFLDPPKPPRGYVRWKFQDLNMLLGQDTLVVRTPDHNQNTRNTSSTTTTSNTNTNSDFAVRVEDARFLKNVWETLQQQRGQAPKLLPSERSYAQALLQEQTNAPTITTSNSNNPQTTRTTPNNDEITTCIVPFGNSSTNTTSPGLSIVLDAYLDNLMANVPQLALCLEEKGLIQSIKMLATEEIPSKFLHPSTLDLNPTNKNHSHNTQQLEDTLFSPQIMETNASALLRFLKTNCTQNHSTYLLRHEEGKVQNLQLYDISAISAQKQKKWIWWLATMSYRFAVRLRHLENDIQDESQKRSIRDRQRSLLQQTLELLQDLMDIDGKAHESMVASVREHLADTYLNSSGNHNNTTNGNGTSTAEDSSKSTADSPRKQQQHPEVSASPPVVTATISSSSVVLPNTADTNSYKNNDQPYASVLVDALNKAQDHLVRGIKVLSTLQVNQEQEEQSHQKPTRSRRRKRSHMPTANSNNNNHNNEVSPAIILQLFGMNFKLVNISLRLAEHHLQNYYSSSAMQALRTAARWLNDAADLLQVWKSQQCKENDDGDDSNNKDERQESLQLQYIWLLEHCGHFARSFASDELWRDRGHVSGEDVISVLTDVEGVFEESNLFSQKDVLLQKSKGKISLQRLSGIVAPSRSDKIELAIHAAIKVLEAEPLLRRERRRVLVASCVLYSRAITAFSSTEAPVVLLNVLRQRLGDACNETGKVLLAALRTLLVKHQGARANQESQLAAEALIDSAEFWFTVGLEVFDACEDSRNLALLRCNICQSFKLRANSGFKKDGEKSSPKHAEDCLQKAADQLLKAHVDLGVRDKDPQTWDMVSGELAATFLVLGVRRRQSLLGSGNTPMIFLRLSPGQERSVVDPMERALKIYEQSDNAHQAAAVHYQLALTFSKLWTSQRNEANTRKKLSKAFEHYSSAFDYFSAHSRGNEPTFCLLCLDLASLYAAIPGEEGLIKSLGCCLDCCDTFSSEAIDMGASLGNSEWYETMGTIAQSVDDRVFKLLRSLVKADPTRYKNMYREGLTAKMVRNVYEERSDALLGLHEVLLAVKKMYGVNVSK